MSTPLRERPDAPLGTLIFRAGLLPAETIESALQESSRTGKRLGEILLERNLLDESELSRLLAGQKGLPFVSLREQGVDADAARLFSEDQARLYRALPFGLEDGSPVVAISDPTNEVMMRNIREALDGTEVQFAVATRSELAALMTEIYQPNGNGASPAPALAAEPEYELEPEEPEAAAAEHESPELDDPAPAEPDFQPEPDGATELDPALPEPALIPEPEVQLEAVPEPEAVPAAAPDPEPELEPVATAEPELAPEAAMPVAPPVSDPIAEPPLRTIPAVAEAAPAPTLLRLAPPPQAAPVDETEATAESVTVRVVIRLSNNDRVEAAVVGDVNTAKAQAKALIRYIAGKDRSDWPYIGGRFIRPDAIVSVDLVEPVNETGSG